MRYLGTSVKYSRYVTNFECESHQFIFTHPVQYLLDVTKLLRLCYQSHQLYFNCELILKQR